MRTSSSFPAALAFALLATTAGCAATMEYDPYGYTSANMVAVAPGVWSVSGYSVPVYYADGAYFVWSNNVWYRSTYVNYGFAPVPITVVPWGVRTVVPYGGYYAPPAYGGGYYGGGYYGGGYYGGGYYGRPAPPMHVQPVPGGGYNPAPPMHVQPVPGGGYNPAPPMHVQPPSYNPAPPMHVQPPSYNPPPPMVNPPAPRVMPGGGGGMPNPPPPRVYSR